MQRPGSNQWTIPAGRPFLTFLIESLDGRIRICTASPDLAVEHYKALRGKGIEATISDITGTNYTLKSLHRHADLRSREVGTMPAGAKPARRWRRER